MTKIVKKLSKRQELFNEVIKRFETNMPIAETELHFESPFQLLVAVILSAQCTDKRVNIITEDLFKRFPNVESMSIAPVEEVFEYIKSCSYPNNKSKHLVGMAQMLIEKFNGIVPSDVNELQKLPGVGRKTANVIASVVFDEPAMAVDTHVFRVTARIGLTLAARNPLQTELQLVKYFPENLIAKAHHWLILHGRYVCIARKPKCMECFLVDVCKYQNKNLL